MKSRLDEQRLRIVRVSVVCVSAHCMIEGLCAGARHMLIHCRSTAARGRRTRQRCNTVRSGLCRCHCVLLSLM